MGRSQAGFEITWIRRTHFASNTDDRLWAIDSDDATSPMEMATPTQTQMWTQTSRR